MAQELGLRKVVALTTGNFGCSLAAYAAAAGFECVVFCHEEASQAIVDLIQLFGARVVIGGPRAAFLETLVREGGWFPACGVAPCLEVCSPFGVEGFKSIAYEIFEQLGNETPEAVFMPVGSGDGFYGVWKGFRELKLMGLTRRLPRMYACQAEGSNPVVRSFRAGLQAVVGVTDPRSVALSIREATSSSLALQAVYASGGEAIDCSEGEIEDAWQLLCHSGICVEASSAVPVACGRKFLAAHQLARIDRVVCLLTGAGIKWPEFLAAHSPRKQVSGAVIGEPQAMVAALRDTTSN
jgi:threonine synthase